MQVWAADQAHGVARYEQVVMQGDAGMGCSSDLRTSAGGNTSLLSRQLLSLLCQAHHLACIPPTHAITYAIIITYILYYIILYYIILYYIILCYVILYYYSCYVH